MKSLKIAVAQVASSRGDVEKNLEIHQRVMVQAQTEDVSLLIFPELSLTGYEPDLAQELAFVEDDPRLEVLKQAALEYGLWVVAGIPLATEGKPQIGAVIVSDQGQVCTYAKINLHPGEETHFSAGEAYRSIELARHEIGMAICADINVPAHVQVYARQGIDVYAAGVFITAEGYRADVANLKSYARHYEMLVAMANYPQGVQTACGRSGIWWNGQALAVANETQEALVVAQYEEGQWSGAVVEVRV